MVCIVRESPLAGKSPSFGPVLPFYLGLQFCPLCHRTLGVSSFREKHFLAGLNVRRESTKETEQKKLLTGKIFWRFSRGKCAQSKKFDSWSKQDSHTRVNLRSLTFYFGQWLLAERGALVRRYVYVYRECPSVGGGCSGRIHGQDEVRVRGRIGFDKLYINCLHATVLDAVAWARVACSCHSIHIVTSSHNNLKHKNMSWNGEPMIATF